MNAKSRYSEVVLAAFYQITLDKGYAQCLDRHVLAAAHHLIRARESVASPALWKLHNSLFFEHVREVNSLVAMHGDFSLAIDSSERGLEKRCVWAELDSALPDPGMYDTFSAADPDCSAGEFHPWDDLLVTNAFDSRKRAA